MSFLAKLFINGKAINVLDTNVQFYQQFNNATQQPEGIPNGGLFDVTIEADGTTDMLGLAISPDTMCEGYIRFYKRDGMSKLVDYEFFDTYIVHYERYFRAFTGEPASDLLRFSPGILRIGDVVFEKWWKITDLNAKQAATTVPVQEEKQPRVVDYYITDAMNNRIQEAKIGDTIFLNVKTKDMIGESMNIDLKDQTVDFKYQGKLLTNDMLTDLQVTGNLEKIELEVVAPSQQSD